MRLLERALAAEEMARKAFSALDVLRKNLLEHLEDLHHWEELSQIDVDPSKLTVYDEKKVNAELKSKPFEGQVNYLSDNLQQHNRTITRILRVKVSQFDNTKKIVGVIFFCSCRTPSATLRTPSTSLPSCT